MSWSNTGSPDPKYRTAAYQRESARLKADYKQRGWATCAQPECVEPTRDIHWPSPVHTLHDETGTVILGLGHPGCNLHHAGVKGNARSKVAGRWKL